MDSVPGLYEDVLVLDFKSLYPSIIRTFLVDPLGLATAGEDAVEGFGGARFSRDEAHPARLDREPLGGARRGQGRRRTRRSRAPSRS